MSEPQTDQPTGEPAGERSLGKRVQIGGGVADGAEG